ncbi:DUF397 domain-containing protein [Sphaerisporangium sp. B11E5]|uniref:DUF397 domain-containing protein n=1 Tax=Sphaerisporangium sp. B11E5 TaxID=3153563 RepID=UPI00325F2405
MDELMMVCGTTHWTRSSYSGSNGGNCVEVARLPGARRAVRDSKDSSGVVLVVGGRQWSAFVAGVKARTLGGRA